MLGNLKNIISGLNYSSTLTELEFNRFKLNSVTTVSQIRKAIQSGKPVIASISGKPVTLVGEDQNELAAEKDGKIYSIPDSELSSIWDGEAVAVDTDKEPERQDMIIRLPELDTWPPELEERKSFTCTIADKLNDLPCWLLPAHPIILKFLNPDEAHKNVRAYSDGAEIAIIDGCDPAMEFLHEVGHLFWRTRVSDENQSKWFCVHENLLRMKECKKLPAIFTAEAMFRDKEETFCTVYAWYLCGEIRHAGFTKILETTFPVGYSELCSILDQLKSDYEAKEEEKKSMQEWEAQAPRVALELAKLRKEGTFSINGQLRKAKIISSPSKLTTIYPPAGAYKITAENRGRQWVELTGILAGQRAILKAGQIDFDYMAAHPRSIKQPFSPRLLKANQVKPKPIEPEKSNIPANDPWLPENRPLPVPRMFAEMPCIVETPAGDSRYWTDQTGKRGQTKMENDYGYIQTADGADGDRLDAFFGPDEESETVTIIHQNNPETGKFDEDKVMLGFPDSESALETYKKHYDSPEKFYGGHKVMPIQHFRDKVTNAAPLHNLEGKKFKKAAEVIRAIFKKLVA